MGTKTVLFGPFRESSWYSAVCHEHFIANHVTEQQTHCYETWNNTMICCGITWAVIKSILSLGFIVTVSLHILENWSTVKLCAMVYDSYLTISTLDCEYMHHMDIMASLLNPSIHHESNYPSIHHRSINSSIHHQLTYPSIHHWSQFPSIHHQPISQSIHNQSIYPSVHQ